MFRVVDTNPKFLANMDPGSVNTFEPDLDPELKLL